MLEIYYYQVKIRSISKFVLEKNLEGLLAQHTFLQEPVEKVWNDFYV